MSHSRKMHSRSAPQVKWAAIAVAALGCCAGAQAVELMDNESMSVRWDNTLKYGVAARTASASGYYVNNPNTNDGDGAFDRWDLISNRVDLLTELDIAFKTAVPSGLRVVGAAWYDQVYNDRHKPLMFQNTPSVANDEFTKTTRRMAGRDGDLLDAFIYGGVDLGGRRLQVRLGRHTLIWGESLFLAGNGVAAGMSALDGLKALSVPQTQAKELFMPTNQLSASLSLSDRWGLQGYYQLEFRENRFPPVGHFFSPSDAGFQGMDALYLPPVPGFPPALNHAGVRNKPKNAQGNYGLAAKYSNLDADLDMGFYFVRYTDRQPQVYTDLFGVGGSAAKYYFVYPKNIQIYGMSASTKFGDANVAAEASVRRNMPLLSQGPLMDLIANPTADNDRNPQYAVGNTFHLQASTIWVLPRVSWWDTSSITAEVGGHSVMKVTKNAALRDPTKKRNFAASSLVFDPTWYQVAPDLDLTIPLSLGYSFTGFSPIDPGSSAHGGTVGAGLKFSYQRVWRANINYTKYLGRDANTAFGDRDNLSFTIARTF